MSSEDNCSDSLSDYSDFKVDHKPKKDRYSNKKKYNSEDRCEYTKSSSYKKNDDYSDDECEYTKETDCYTNECGLSESKTPVGVWNFVYCCDTTTTTDGCMEWINQVLLNGDKTFNSFGAPDVCTMPLPCQVTPALGVWDMISERKIQLDSINIGYRNGDGATKYYVKTRMILKLNSKGTRMRFCGESRTYDIKDPRACIRTDIPALCFSGHGVKVLEPKC
jgi:hypothetical protein